MKVAVRINGEASVYLLQEAPTDTDELLEFARSQFPPETTILVQVK